MAGRAVTRRRCLMVTDLAAAGWHECEAGVGAACDMTGEAGELLVAIVREGVDGSGERGARSRGSPWRVGIALPFPFRFRRDQRSSPQRPGSVEGLRRVDAAAGSLLDGRMAPRAVARVHLCAMGLMTQRALLRHLAVRRSRMERLVSPVGVAPGGCATLDGVGGSGLLVRVMAHAARLPVRIASRIEVREFRAHGVAARLRARGVHRHEAMHLEAVARRALNVAQRAGIGLEMDAMARRRRDPLPFLFFAIALDVTARANAGRDFRMHRDFLGPISDPEVELARAGENRLLMAGVAAQGIMLGAGESLERALHDVAAGAEGVVVLHVVPADRAKPRRAEDERRRRRNHADSDAALSRFDPADDRQAAAPENDEEPRRDAQANEKAADLKPLGEIEKEAQHGGHAARQRRRADSGLLKDQHLLLIGRPPPESARSAVASPEPADPRADSADRRSNVGKRSRTSAAPRARTGCARRYRMPCAWRSPD